RENSCPISAFQAVHSWHIVLLSAPPSPPSYTEVPAWHPIVNPFADNRFMNPVPPVRILLLATLLLFGGSAPLPAEPLPALLSDDSLTGFEVPDGNIWWEVEEGILHGKSDPEQ